jgi:hypothetical protein
MTRTWILTAVAGAVLAAAIAVPAAAADGYYRNERCYDRDQDATGGGLVAGAIVGGAVGGPAGAVVGGAIGGAAGDDSVDCRYERYEGAYYGDGYDNRSRRDGDYAEGYGGRDRDGYRQGYRDGYNDRYGNDYRLNGMDRGYHADGYYYRRSTYREGYYDRYGVWHPDRDSSDRSYRPY